jgi:hypothetical protein
MAITLPDRPAGERRTAKTKLRRRPAAATPPRRPERVAPLTDRAHGGAALVRASQWIKRRNASPIALIFRCRALAMTPYLAEPRRARPAPRRPHDRSLQKPELHRSPPTKITKMESATATSLGSRSAALDLNAGRSAGGARRSAPPRARETCVPLRFAPPSTSLRNELHSVSMPRSIIHRPCLLRPPQQNPGHPP